MAMLFAIELVRCFPRRTFVAFLKMSDTPLRRTKHSLPCKAPPFICFVTTMSASSPTQCVCWLKKHSGRMPASLGPNSSNGVILDACFPSEWVRTDLVTLRHMSNEGISTKNSTTLFVMFFTFPAQSRWFAPISLKRSADSIPPFHSMAKTSNFVGVLTSLALV